MKTKICKTCKKQKSLSCFYKNKKAKDGLDYHCRDCRKQIGAKKYNANPQKHMAYAMKWAKNNPDRHKHFARKTVLKTRYHMTIEEYDKLLQKQNGVCAICGKRETAKNKYGVKRLAIDHNHITGVNRGLLCGKCNIGLGYFNVDECGIDLLLKTIEYTRKY